MMDTCNLSFTFTRVFHIVVYHSDNCFLLSATTTA